MVDETHSTQKCFGPLKNPNHLRTLSYIFDKVKNDTSGSLFQPSKLNVKWLYRPCQVRSWPMSLISLYMPVVKFWHICPWAKSLNVGLSSQCPFLVALGCQSWKFSPLFRAGLNAQHTVNTPILHVTLTDKVTL